VRSRKDSEALLDIEFWAGRAGVELGYARARLAAGTGDPDTLALVESAQGKVQQARELATTLIRRVADRERKQRRR
jgi:hypothetical protein